MSYLRLFIFCFFAVKAVAQVTDKNYRIYSVKAAKEVTIEVAKSREIKKILRSGFIF